MAKILLLHGPNLNLLGRREPDVYGPETLEAVVEAAAAVAHELGLEVESFQSNSEGDLVTRIQEAAFGPSPAAAIVFNPGAYTHTSVALRDAILAAALPVVEVHLTNVHRRESFRRRSLLADVVTGQILGFGVESYRLGVRAAAALLARGEDPPPRARPARTRSRR